MAVLLSRNPEGNEELRRSLGLAGHSKVIALYTWDRIYAQLRRLYCEVIASFPDEHGHA